MPRTMIGIASAPGWAARFESEDGDERIVTLLAWALVDEEEVGRDVVGLVQRPRTPQHPTGQVALADEIDGFAGYVVGALQTKPAAEQ